MDLVGAIAHCGETPTAIGLALASTTATATPGLTAYTFTKLQRSHDWMGFSSILPLLSGLTVVVVESADKPGQPGIVLALPPERVPEPIGSTHFPRGQPAQLKQVLQWHGASPCYWLDRKILEPKKRRGRPRKASHSIPSANVPKAPG